MRNLLLALVISVTAACGGSKPGPGTPAEASTATPDAPIAATVDCGLIDESQGPNLCAPERATTYACVIDALHAGRAATFEQRWTGDDSRGLTRGAVEITGNAVLVLVETDEQAPGIVSTRRCTDAHEERGGSGCTVLVPTDCI